jgi:hypothetical protein
MSNILIRDVPDEVVTAIDAHASALGLSRNEYLRRQLQQEAKRLASPVTVDDLRRFGERHADLADPDVMDGAWS